MKTLLIIIAINLMTLPALFSCSQDNENRQKSTTENLIEQQSDINLHNEHDILPQNVLRKRKASMVLSEFVKLENNQYRLEISKNEAGQLGVSPELYDEIMADLSNTNLWILKALENGDTIEIPDIQSIAKDYKNGNLKD